MCEVLIYSNKYIVGGNDEFEESIAADHHWTIRQLLAESDRNASSGYIPIQDSSRDYFSASISQQHFHSDLFCLFYAREFLHKQHSEGNEINYRKFSWDQPAEVEKSFTCI